MIPLTCKYCLYFDSIGILGAQSGQCRRHAPQMRGNVYREPADGTEDWAIWPIVNEEDWCGDGRTLESADPLLDIHGRDPA